MRDKSSSSPSQRRASKEARLHIVLQTDTFNRPLNLPSHGRLSSVLVSKWELDIEPSMHPQLPVTPYQTTSYYVPPAERTTAVRTDFHQRRPVVSRTCKQGGSSALVVVVTSPAMSMPSTSWFLGPLAISRRQRVWLSQFSTAVASG